MTIPDKEKNASVIQAALGNSCWRKPLFCINNIQPIEPIYGGVINGIVRTISSQLYLYKLVFVLINAMGNAIIVVPIITKTPNSIEFPSVCHTLSLANILLICETSNCPSFINVYSTMAINGAIANVMTSVSNNPKDRLPSIIIDISILP